VKANPEYVLTGILGKKRKWNSTINERAEGGTVGTFWTKNGLGTKMN
jgi:hypothetical protein